MSWRSDFYGNVYSTAKELGATDTQAHLAAAQASQETGYGQHVVGNNYFGVKASPSYTGDTVTANTSEGEDAVSNRMDQSFRAYDGLKASVANYMDVMSNAFPDAWNATNIADAAKGLVSGKFGRYAKDVNYPGKIQSIANKLGAQQKYAYAQAPENVPVPYGPEDDPLANSQQAQATDGMSGLLNPVTTQAVTSSELAAPGEWGIHNNVTPALGPTVEGWSAMAAANPVQAPANGLLGSATPNGFSDLAAAGPMGLLSAPNISQSDISRALTNVTGKNEFDPSFTAGLMGPNNPVVPNAVETTSYTDPAAAVATGINSPEHKQIQAMAEAQLAATRAVQPGIPTSGLLASNPALAAPNFSQALNPTMPGLSVPTVDAANAYAQQPAITPAEQAINTITAPPGYHVSDLDGVTMVKDVVAQAPAMETVSVPDQPTIAGPATTEIAPAQEQQQTQQVQQAQAGSMAAPQSLSLGDKLKAAVNPGTAIGGLLGAATMGPIGGLLGGLLGNSINNGSFSGLLGQGPVGSGGYVGAGPMAAYSVYGGGLAPGSYATASDGSTVTSRENGDVSRTNTFGVTDTANSYGGYAGDWSGLF